MLPVNYSGLVVFGDSLSDTGNFADTAEDEFGLRYPGPVFDYTNGRFTNGDDTSPGTVTYQGVWHEQLCRLFLGLSTARPSLDGGTDYAFGDAETTTGQRAVSISDYLDIHIDNLGRQVSNYLNQRTPDSAALFVVWAGANDLFAAEDAKNPTSSSVNAAAITAAANVTSNVERLARAGAYHFLVNNLPPLGATPDYNQHPGAAARLNDAAVAFSDALNTDLDDLTNRLADDGVAIDLKRLDVYALFNRLLATGGAPYGFRNITDSAQGDPDAVADRHLFWDGVHPTVAGHFQLAAEAFSLLTGIPVVEIHSQYTKVWRNDPAARGFIYLTRTGPDLSKEFTVYYSQRGTAQAGRDYRPLRGSKHFAPGVRTATVAVVPYAAPAGTPEVTLTLGLELLLSYELAPYPSAGVRLDTK